MIIFGCFIYPKTEKPALPRSGQNAHCDLQRYAVVGQSASDCLNTFEGAVYQNGLNEDGGKTIESTFHYRSFKVSMPFWSSKASPPTIQM